MDYLYGDPELAQFYDLVTDGLRLDFNYCLQLAEDAHSVLDLGCGTGALAARMADRRTVVGVDPAAAMLDIARSRPGGQRVTWEEADARNVRLGRQFDLVLLTGHAYQVFLTDEDQRAVLSTIARHLGPGGRFIFDTRNPDTQTWRNWTEKGAMRKFEHPSLGTVERWSDAVRDEAVGIVTYKTYYRIVASDRHLCAASKIRFTPRDRLAAMVDEAGLVVDEWLGDWKGGAFGPASREIIPVGRRA